MGRVSDAGPPQCISTLWGRRPKASREGTRGGEVAVVVYGDLTAGRLVRVMRRSAEESAGWQVQWSEQCRCRFREGDIGVTGEIARVFSGSEAAGPRHRKRHPPAGDAVAAVVMASQS
jgi:hypothetical protein